MFEDDDSVFLALRAGARGYLLKGADEDELPAPIRAVARGRGDLQPGRRRPACSHFFAAAAAGAEVFPELTDREREILGADRRRATPTRRSRGSCS